MIPISKEIMKKSGCIKCGTKRNLIRYDFTARKTVWRPGAVQKFNFYLRTYQMPVCLSCRQEFKNFDRARRGYWMFGIAFCFILGFNILFDIQKYLSWRDVWRLEWALYLNIFFIIIGVIGIIFRLSIFAHPNHKITSHRNYIVHDKYLSLLVKPGGFNEWLTYKRWLQFVLEKDNFKYYEQALDEIDKIIQNQTNDHSLYFKKTQILRALQKYHEALITIDKALELSPHDRVYAREKYSILRGMSRSKEAAAFLKQEKKFLHLRKNEML